MGFLDISESEAIAASGPSSKLLLKENDYGRFTSAFFDHSTSKVYFQRKYGSKNLISKLNLATKFMINSYSFRDCYYDYSLNTRTIFASPSSYFAIKHCYYGFYS